MAISADDKVQIFLSYGRADAEELAERLEADLTLLGFHVWRDRRQIRSGKEWDDQIEAGLRLEPARRRGAHAACRPGGERLPRRARVRPIRAQAADRPRHGRSLRAAVRASSGSTTST